LFHDCDLSLIRLSKVIAVITWHFHNRVTVILSKVIEKAFAIAIMMRLKKSHLDLIFNC